MLNTRFKTFAKGYWKIRILLVIEIYYQTTKKGLSLEITVDMVV